MADIVGRGFWVFWRIVFFICGMAWIIFMTDRDGKAPSKANESFRHDSHMFSGVITKVLTSNNHGKGILSLRILKSNRREYDIRDSAPYYYCVIKDSVAEVYDGAYDFMPSDTMYIRSPQLISYFRTGEGTKDSGSIQVAGDDVYYDLIRKNTRFQKK